MESKKNLYVVINPHNMYKVQETKKGCLGKRQIIVVEKNKLPTKQKVKSKFVLVKSSQMLHDKDCQYVSRAKYYEEVNSIDEQQENRFCKKCYRKAVLRNGVTDLHIAKLNGRVCGAKRPHSVSKRSVNAMFE